MKNYCKFCGEKLNAEQVHVCPKRPIKNFFLKVGKSCLNILNKTGYADVHTADKDYYEKGQLIIPDSINATEGETPIKQYDLAILRSRLKLTRAEGRMQITNKRLLFRATGRSPLGKTTYQHEFALDKLDGIEIRKDYRFMPGDLFIGLLLQALIVFFVSKMNEWLQVKDSMFMGFIFLACGVALCVPFFTVYKRFLLKLVTSSFAAGLLSCSYECMHYQNLNVIAAFAFAAGLIACVIMMFSLFLSCFKPNLTVEVKTSGGTPAVQIKHKYSSFFVWKKMEEYSGFAEILPGKDADLAIKEMGSIIDKLNTIGDLGVDNW